jgi:hypothetical protein
VRGEDDVDALNVMDVVLEPDAPLLDDGERVPETETVGERDVAGERVTDCEADCDGVKDGDSDGVLLTEPLGEPLAVSDATDAVYDGDDAAETDGSDGVGAEL